MTAWLIAQGLSPRMARNIAIGVAVTVAAIALFGAASLWLSGRDARIVDGHEAKTSAKLERTGRQADASAAQRAEARRRVEVQARKDFDDATADVPDNGLTARQRIDLCRELREAGTDTSLIPQCNVVRSGAQAGP